jgi:hypothetical protein
MGKNSLSNRTCGDFSIGVYAELMIGSGVKQIGQSAVNAFS